MPEITLELIQYVSETYGQPQSIELDIVNHVHKRIERFVYQRMVNDSSIPIAYIENQSLDSQSNLQIANRTFSIPINSNKHIGLRSPISIITSTSAGSCYKNIVATNQTFVDAQGKIRPLFWRHDLPDNVTECQLQIVTRGNRHVVDTGYLVDLEAGAIYTNYRNFFDPDTGAYRLFFVVCTGTDGSTFHELLNPEPVAKEADWKDIDLTTGALTKAYPVFSKERSSSGYTFFFNDADTWYIRPLESALIQPRFPVGRTATDPWFIRFSDGDFSANVNSAVHRYYVPEFDKQSFIPSKPTIYSPYERMLRVNNSVIAATRKNLSINPSSGLHLNIFIKDVNGVLIKALTTDAALEGVRFSETDVFYESDKILSWDNPDGIIALGLELHRSWQFSATYYYEADDYEYTLVDLNPLTNPDVLDYTFVFYMIPDTNVEDRAIHHLVVDASGTIISASQEQGFSYPNFQLLNADNSFNSDTVIGLKYISDIIEDTFITRYTAGFENSFAYGILAEVSVVDISMIEDQFEVDVRRSGAVIKPELFEEVIQANPKILQSYLGYGEDGQEVPQSAVMVLKAPLSMLEDWGGVLSQEAAERLLRIYMPSAGHAVIEFEGPSSVLSGWSESIGIVSLEATWEGPDYDYRLYRRPNITGEWALIDTVSSPPEGTILYTDLNVSSGETYYYSVRIYDGDFEYPAYNSLGVKVR